MFYTYAHYTPEGRLFYIGKGSGGYKRAYRFVHRSAHWHSIVAKHGKPKVKILAHWDTEDKAFAHERFLIAHFRAAGHVLCNMTEGGEGSLGLVKSEKAKRKVSAALKGRPGVKPSEATRKKLSESHKGQVAWNKGVKGVTKQSPETIEKKAAKMRGRLYNAEFMYKGTHIKFGTTLFLTGNAQIKRAGMSPSCIRRCAIGDRKSHKGYSWAREPVKKLLGDLQCL